MSWSQQVFHWADAAGLNSFDVRSLSSGDFLLTAGHGPHQGRHYTSVVLDPDALRVLGAAIADLEGAVTS